VLIFLLREARIRALITISGFGAELMSSSSYLECKKDYCRTGNCEIEDEEISKFVEVPMTGRVKWFNDQKGFGFIEVQGVRTYLSTTPRTRGKGSNPQGGATLNLRLPWPQRLRPAP
jgi:hypothetical protein